MQDQGVFFKTVDLILFLVFFMFVPFSLPWSKCNLLFFGSFPARNGNVHPFPTQPNQQLCLPCLLLDSAVVLTPWQYIHFYSEGTVKLGTWASWHKFRKNKCSGWSEHNIAHRPSEALNFSSLKPAWHRESAVSFWCPRNLFLEWSWSELGWMAFTVCSPTYLKVFHSGNIYIVLAKLLPDVVLLSFNSSLFTFVFSSICFTGATRFRT